MNSCLSTLFNWSTSNCKQHMESNHKNDYWGNMFKMDISGSSPSIDSKNNTAKKSFDSKQTSLVSTSTPLLSHKLITEKGNDLQLQYMRACNIAACHSNSPELSRYLDHIIQHSAFYAKNKKAVLMGRNKLRNQRYRSFDNLVQVITKLVGKTRDWLQTRTCSRFTPFITVGHDGWDSKDNDMLGVCIHFTDTGLGVRRTIAVGIQHLISKKSVDVAEHILKILER